MPSGQNAGSAGIGKSALVNEIHKPIVEKRGYFISGKFDQFGRNIPYFAFIQAFQDFIHQLLSEPEEQITLWKEKLLKALGPNGRIISDVIPEVEFIIGKQSDVPELPLNQAQNRFNFVFQNFIKTCAVPEHPLVIFLDDLQWADSSSLNLIELFMTGSMAQFILLIGAYRDNEVSETHPLMLKLRDIQQAGATVKTISLKPLELEHINQLIADTTQPSRPDRFSKTCQVSLPLAELSLQKTRGNPFFFKQFLQALYEQQLLEFDPNNGTWRWEFEDIYLCGYFECTKHYVTTISQHTANLLDTVKVCEVNIQMNMAQGDLIGAIKSGLTLLSLLDINLPEKPNNSQIHQMLLHTRSMLYGKSIDELARLPQMSDPHKLAAMHILSGLISPTFVANPKLMVCIVLQQVQFSVKYGNAPSSPFAYVNYGFILCELENDIMNGEAFGQLALSLLHQPYTQKLKTRTAFIFNAMIRHWKEHVKETLPPLLDVYQTGLEHGDLPFSVYAIVAHSLNSYHAGKELVSLEYKMGQYCEAIAKLKQASPLSHLKIYRQVVFNLLTGHHFTAAIHGEFYDEEEMRPIHEHTNDQNGLFFLYLNKLILSCLFDSPPDMTYAVNAEKFLESAGTLSPVPVFVFYDSLVRLAVYPESPKTEEETILAKIAANQKKMAHWAKYAPMNYLHKYYLVYAAIWIWNGSMKIALSGLLRKNNR